MMSAPPASARRASTGRDHADEQLHGPATARASTVEVDHANLDVRTHRRAQPGRDVGSARSALDDPVHRRPPRALADGPDPEPVQRLDDRRRLRVKNTALLRGEHRSDLALDLGERGAELVDVLGHEPREQRGQHQARHPRLDGGPVRLQQTEKSLLSIPGQTLDPEGEGEHAPPALWHRVPSHQRAEPAAAQHAGLDHEARSGEGPGAHARALSAPGGVRELDRPGGDPRELGHSARDREAELRAGTQSGVRRNRLAYIDLNAPRIAERLACPAGERGSAIGLRSVRDDLLARPVADRHDHPRGLDAHADASEPPRADPGRIEHSEVQPRRRGDHDLGHVRSATYRRT